MFGEIGWRPHADLASALVELNGGGEIQIQPDCSPVFRGFLAGGEGTKAALRCSLISQEKGKGRRGGRQWMQATSLSMLGEDPWCDGLPVKGGMDDGAGYRNGPSVWNVD